MLTKLLRIIISILFVPACVAFTLSFYDNLSFIKIISESQFIFILGMLSYSIMHLLLFKLNFLYVVGHEAMHAISTLFSGGKVTGMKVSDKEGSVKTTTPNFFVVLAPYLVPIYTVLLAILYFLLSFFTDVARFSGHFIFFAGFTLMFHLSYTAESIREKQSDLIKTGYLFSLSLIYIANLIIVFAILGFLFKEASFVSFISGSCQKTKDFYYYLWKQLFL